MRLDAEIKKLLQKEEQEIVGQQISTEKIELLEIDKSQNKLKCDIHDYSTREIQTSMNRSKNEYRLGKHKLKTRNLQEEIVKTNRTTHLIKREGSINIEMSEKEEISPLWQTYY
ncbi:8684_t:CDS:2 [Gigaspora margarita]|uniref:8684_t:CDS:1 n=1 Tax=Gigaspora margarita TaxID=4874 RepID=A0ABM8VWX5_GIGMA|nr:8684_t:CDS:2 [Gigaspora margarita]